MVAHTISFTNPQRKISYREICGDLGGQLYNISYGPLRPNQLRVKETINLCSPVGVGWSHPPPPILLENYVGAIFLYPREKQDLQHIQINTGSDRQKKKKKVHKSDTDIAQITFTFCGFRSYSTQVWRFLRSIYAPYDGSLAHSCGKWLYH